jgi:6-phosphofructokinase 2
VLDALLDAQGVRRKRVNIADHTRISLAVHERQTGQEYRFVPEGPKVSEAEWQDCLDVIERCTCDWLVASGSLPRGVPGDFYARVAAIARKSGARFVLDTSGEALGAALAQGGVFLVKPSKGELEQMEGHTLADSDALILAARGIIERGEAIHVAVSMGHEGALLVNADGALHLPAVPVEVRSAVGAGDSFVAAMVHAFAVGRDVGDAFRLGVAAGTAAVMTPGTDLCHRADVERLFELIAGRPLVLDHSL